MSDEKMMRMMNDGIEEDIEGVADDIPDQATEAFPETKHVRGDDEHLPLTWRSRCGSTRLRIFFSMSTLFQKVLLKS